MKDCYYSKYEPIFGAWHITGELGAGREGHLYRISREDAIGHVSYSALKAITIPAGGEAELDSLIAGGMSRDEAEHYFDSILESAAGEFELLEKLKGNSNIVSYEDHEIFRREEGFGWDILIRMEELTPLVSHSVYHRMDEAEILRMGLDLCRGLVLCRRFGIVHRDIKPENIFISAAGSYKLGDFGIARMIDETDSTLSRKGTYSYMAPEVYWGKEYDHTVDIYSLGMVMYRYLNDGRLPFMPVYPDPAGYRDEETAFVRRVNGETLPAPRNGSDALQAVVLKACSYDSSERYSSAEEMLGDLEALNRDDALQAGSSAADAASALYTSGSSSAPDAASADRAGIEHLQSRSPIGRKRTMRRIAGAILLLLIAAAGIAYALIPKEVEDIETAGLEDGAEIYIGEDLAPEYTVRPDWFKDEPVAFETSNEDVLTVDESGHLHAVSIGDAVLTIRAKEYSEKDTIRVIPKVSSIEGIDEAISMTTGTSMALEPVLKPKKFSSEPITYSTGDEAVAAVSDKGTLTAVSAGETSLEISAGGCTFTAKVTVTDPVVYTYRSNSSGKSSGSSSGSSGSSGSGSKSSSSKASKGYFDSSDDEEF